MDLSDPGIVVNRLAEIENDLALRQNELEAAASDFAYRKRDFEREYASAFLSLTDGSIEEKKQRARLAVEGDLPYAHAQGKYEGLKAVVRVLEARASIGQSILRSHVRQS